MVMESNKFEKDFRNKLNKREIAPSENSWDRLDAMLTVAEKKQPKKDSNDNKIKIKTEAILPDEKKKPETKDSVKP